MINLIVTIIAIALVILLTLATLYFVKDYATDGNARAKATQSVTEGSQISGAFELFRSDHDGRLPRGTQEEIKAILLDNSYLKKWPAETWELQNDYAIFTEMTPEMCLDVNKKLGFKGIPVCSDIAIDRRHICCSTGADVTVQPGHGQIPGVLPDANTDSDTSPEGEPAV